MRKQKFTIAGRLDGMNELISANRRSQYIGAKEKREQQDICKHAIRACKVRPVLKYPVRIVLNWYEKNIMRDPDNIAAAKKFIMDALQETKTIRNDGFKEIKSFGDLFYVDKKNPRIEVVIIESE